MHLAQREDPDKANITHPHENGMVGSQNNHHYRMRVVPGPPHSPDFIGLHKQDTLQLPGR